MCMCQNLLRIERGDNIWVELYALLHTLQTKKGSPYSTSVKYMYSVLICDCSLVIFSEAERPPPNLNRLERCSVEASGYCSR